MAELTSQTYYKFLQMQIFTIFSILMEGNLCLASSTLSAWIRGDLKSMQTLFKVYVLSSWQKHSTLFKTRCTDRQTDRHWPLLVIRFRSHTCSAHPDALNALKQHLHAWSVRCHVQVENAAMLCLSRRMLQYKHSSGSHHTMLTWANLLMQSKQHQIKY